MPEHDSTALPTVRRTLAQIHDELRAQKAILFALAEALLSLEELDDLRATLSERGEA